MEMSHAFCKLMGLWAIVSIEHHLNLLSSLFTRSTFVTSVKSPPVGSILHLPIPSSDLCVIQYISFCTSLPQAGSLFLQVARWSISTWSLQQVLLLPTVDGLVANKMKQMLTQTRLIKRKMKPCVQRINPYRMPATYAYWQMTQVRSCRRDCWCWSGGWLVHFNRGMQICALKGDNHRVLQLKYIVWWPNCPRQVPSCWKVSSFWSEAFL